MTNPQTILNLLLAAGHVSQATVDEATRIADTFFKGCEAIAKASEQILAPEARLSEPEDHKLTFPEILRPYLRVDTNRTAYEARKDGVSMQHIAKVLGITPQAVSYANRAYRAKHGLKKIPRYKGHDKDFRIYYEVNFGLACYELRKQEMEWPAIKEATRINHNACMHAFQYAKNHNQPWPITFAG